MRYLLWLSTVLISVSAFTASASTDVETVSENESTLADDQLITAPIDKLVSNAVETEELTLPPPISSLKESEIPVLSAAKSKKVEEKSSSTRVVLSMFIIALLAGGMLYFSRWYAKHNKVNTETTKIRVLGQHFLGPRKSLAIVRVAGETILIGVTDQNISMLKSLSLIDDEFPESVPNSFAKTLSATEEDADDFVISSIKDKVSAKIKNMRNI